MLDTLKPLNNTKALIFACMLMVQSSGLFAQPEFNQSVKAELHAYEANKDYELAILNIIDSVQMGRLERAAEQVDAHLIAFPKSQVGHLLRADVLTALTGELSGVAANGALPTERVAGLTHQMRNRWQHGTEDHVDAHQKFPSSLLVMGDHPYVVVADMPQGRLYLYQNDQGTPKLIRDYYMSVGAAGYGKQIEGDNKTPVGVYAINRYIEGKALPDLYGKGAFPVDYPNRYDRYLKRTGYGIWLHGTPSDTYARSPWASEGCFVLSNDDLLDIGKFVSADKRTPVILSDTIEWLSLQQMAERKASMVAIVEQWKNDWESLDTNAYLAHYQASEFNLGKGDFSAWKKRKETVNSTKTFVQVDLAIQSLFAYPGVEDMFVVKYKQRYLSDNFAGESDKEQFWKRNESGHWRIIYEG
jgi:murein L,D-transpeptidase YafK